jgi:DNA-binding NarL/FixJ family response regulator
VADAPALELAEIAASSGSLTERAQWMLDRLRQVAPFDAAWLALADPSPAEAPAGLLGAVVLAPASGDLHGLTPRELEVLGLVIEGLTNQQIARALVVTVRTVATHLEHILVKLDASTRTLAAVRAERRGLYVPSFPIR